MEYGLFSDCVLWLEVAVYERPREQVEVELIESKVEVNNNYKGKKTVEMKPLAGLDGDRISINGLPSNVFHDYVQYESVRHVHKGPDREWSHSGTNGFTSRMLANG